MKCPNCGKETNIESFYCGWCNASLREPAPSTDNPTPGPKSDDESVSITHMRPLIQNRFLRICVMISGVLLAIAGVGFAIFGAYAIAKGSSLQYRINDRIVNAGEFAGIALAIGLAFVFIGFVLRYVYHKEKPVRAE
jgi:hypothetical protein